MNVKNTTLQINVVEYPIINEISFNGNDLIDSEALNETILIKTRDVFNENILVESIEKIKSEYQKIGRYLAEVTIKKTKISNKRIKLLEKFKMWNKLKSSTVVIREVIVPGANLIVPIPKKVTNK